MRHSEHDFAKRRPWIVAADIGQTTPGVESGCYDGRSPSASPAGRNLTTVLRASGHPSPRRKCPSACNQARIRLLLWEAEADPATVTR